jgi:hypothetical protein
MASRLFELLIRVEDNKKFCEGQGEKSSGKSEVGKVQSPRSDAGNHVIVACRRNLGHWTSDFLISFQKIILLNPAEMRILELPLTTFYAPKLFQI